MEKKDKKTLWSEYLIVHKSFQLTLAAAGMILAIGATFYHIVEKLNWLDAFYFSTITLTTVGYGDISPHTRAGKLFTIFYIIIGIGILATLANLIIKHAVAKRKYKKSN